MIMSKNRSVQTNHLAALFAVLWAALALHSFSDILQMTNGDRYSGQVISVDTNSVQFKSEIQGKVNLPRSKVLWIAFQDRILPDLQPAAKLGPKAPPLQGSETNLLQHLQEQIATNPESAQMFNQMMGDFLSGKLSVEDLRRQAEDAAKQLQDLKGELGDDAGPMLDGYLNILQNFLREAQPPNKAVPKSQAVPKSVPSPEEKQP